MRRKATLVDESGIPSDEISRRLFLIRSCAGLGAAWMATCLPEIHAAQEHAHRMTQSESPARFEFLSPGQAVEIEAMAAQIIPTTDTPGAREARVIYFIDRALATFAVSERNPCVQGLKQLQSRAKKVAPKGRKFSELDSKQQIQVLKTIEESPFFDLVRTMTVIGMFANPQYGGNHNLVGWKLIGFDDQFAFKPPFGYYDRDEQLKS